MKPDVQAMPSKVRNPGEVEDESAEGLATRDFSSS